MHLCKYGKQGRSVDTCYCEKQRRRWWLEVLTCSSRKKDPKHGEEVFSWAVVWHRVTAEQFGRITNETVTYKQHTNLDKYKN